MRAYVIYVIIRTQTTGTFNNSETSINYTTIFVRGTRATVYSALLRLIPTKRSRGSYTIINVLVSAGDELKGLLWEYRAISPFTV